VLVVRRLSPVDSILAGAPGRPLPIPIAFQAVDGNGRPVPAAAVEWTVVGTNGRVEKASAVTDAAGLLSAVWVLGTRATEAQGLGVRVEAGKHTAVAGLSATAKPVEVSSIAFRQDTTIVKLGLATALTVQATDPFGNIFVPAALRFASLDTTLCTVDSLGSVQARRRGFGKVVVHAGSAADTAWVHPTQVVQAIVASPDTLRFHSLGQMVQLSVQLLDELGRPVGDSLPSDSVVVDTVVRVQRGSTYIVRSVTNGTTPVILRAGPIAQTVQVVVDQRVATVKVSATRASFDALGDTAQLGTQVWDSLGAPLANQALTYFSRDTSVAKVGPTGMVTSNGNGSTWVFARAMNGVSDSLNLVVAQQVVRVMVKRDSVFLHALQAVLPVEAAAVDRLGFPVTAASLGYNVLNPAIATVDPTGNIRAIANGTTTVTSWSGNDTASVVVRVAQTPVRILLPADTVRFVALGETQAIQAIAVDSLGYVVSSAVTGLRLNDTTVVQQVDSITVRSRANGWAQADFSIAGVPAHAAVVVSQVATRLTAAVTYGKPIVTVPVGAPVPMACQAFDRNGYLVPGDPILTGSPTGTVTGTTCGGVRVQRSGYDTVAFALGSATTRVPVIVAAGPVVSAPLGVPIEADTLPGIEGGPWSPSARTNDAGQTEVYYTAYYKDSTGLSRGDLHRLVWLGGNQFRYDGIVLTHDDDICSPQGQGIENTVIVPRADSIGWRMLYAAGSNRCYGWQVFSAVSVDGRIWSKEPGIRVSNGGSGPTWPPWPAGEGMFVDRLPSGEWRMIIGSFAHVSPPETNTWQITEWRSLDQLEWSYVGPVLTTLDMPQGWQGSVYSPAIRQIGPGLWRMVFTADGRGTPGSRSGIWSAVSTDMEHWQLEGQVLGGPSSNLYYSAIAGDQIVFVRHDDGGPLQLSHAVLTMP